ncbi:MAG TPA: D-alanyl-D-alanine carboxypeptidase family protein, partial [Thermoleophilia bacterium]|nr:D-alanyl-D-alanine carboxypeptidase family protein [Thermoleophilia bacterium]
RRVTQSARLAPPLVRLALGPVFALLVLLHLLATAVARPSPAAAAPPPDVAARAWAVVDARTGVFIGGEDADVSLPMASTTKVMTALVVLREVRDLDTVMTVPDAVERLPFGTLDLVPGTRYTCDELLWALLIDSANDAAVTLAVNVAGSEAAFVRMMNAEARRLGLEGTHYRNTHGIDQEGHYTTARDLCELGRVAMAGARFASYVRHRTHPFTFAETGEKVTLRSHNDFLSDFAWADGVKTGETRNAHFCLAASGAPRGERLVAALLGAVSRERRSEDAGAIMQWGAAQYTAWAMPAPGSVVALVWGPGGRRDLPLALVAGEAGASLPPGVEPWASVDRSLQLRSPLAPGAGLAFVTWRAGQRHLGTGVAYGSAGYVTAAAGDDAP